MTKVYRIELLVIDHDGIGPDQASTVLENAHYPNHCMSPKVVGIEERAVEWSDDHPLNSRREWRGEFDRMFKAGR